MLIPTRDDASTILRKLYNAEFHNLYNSCERRESLGVVGADGGIILKCILENNIKIHLGQIIL
jgi:hypothetical protein